MLRAGARRETVILGSTPLAVAAALLGTRFILALSDFDASRHRRYPLWPLVLRLLLRRARPLIAWNTAARNELIRLGLPRTAVRLAMPPPAVEPDAQLAPGTERHLFTAFLPGQPQSAAAVLRAVAVALEAEPNVQLFATCAPADIEALEQRVAAMGLEANIRLSASDDAPRPSGNAIAVAFCATGEIPNAAFALDAMALGMPIAAAAHTHMSDWLRHGETALLVPPGNETGLADAIVRLLRSPALAQELGQNGRARIIERHKLKDFVSLLTS